MAGLLPVEQVNGFSEVLLSRSAQSNALIELGLRGYNGIGIGKRPSVQPSVGAALRPLIRHQSAQTV